MRRPAVARTLLSPRALLQSAPGYLRGPLNSGGAVPGGIFVSYRRDDSRHAAGRLLDRLRATYQPHLLFMDVDSIAPGRDFVKVLQEHMAGCKVMLVVIGPGWLDARDESGTRRLDNPNDFVRIEVETALARDIRVIPVLVDGATMPREDALPAPLQPLARRQSVQLTHERFGSEASSLVRTLLALVSPAPEWSDDKLMGDAKTQEPATEEGSAQPPGTRTEMRSGSRVLSGRPTKSVDRVIGWCILGLVVGAPLGLVVSLIPLGLLVGPKPTYGWQPALGVALTALGWLMLSRWAANRVSLLWRVWRVGCAAAAAADLWIAQLMLLASEELKDHPAIIFLGLLAFPAVVIVGYVRFVASAFGDSGSRLRSPYHSSAPAS
jgi:TIR domain